MRTGLTILVSIGLFTGLVLAIEIMVALARRAVGDTPDDIPDNITDGDEYPATIIRRGK